MANHKFGALFHQVPGGIEVLVRAIPKASLNKVTGIHQDKSAWLALKVKVTAAPEKGKANKAIIALLAKEWGIAKSTIVVVGGETSRDKRLLIDNEPDELLPSLHAWAAPYFAS